ncbi:MAG: BLUF domain-containing protein [Acidobacteria bacterium]|nr:BLUF domain-containing protein [Acidobacteriota bacterium]
MISLAYTSIATSLFKTSDLFPLLQQSRARNDQIGVTGMLLYQDRSFLQVLEGDDTLVRNSTAPIVEIPATAASKRSSTTPSGTGNSPGGRWHSST